jgi:hypothetical protein
MKKHVLNRQLPDRDIIFHLETEYDVGIIEKIPEQDGKYKYEPFRGIGHYDMATQLEFGIGVKCCARQSKFTVKSRPEYGVIEIEMGW